MKQDNLHNNKNIIKTKVSRIQEYADFKITKIVENPC